MPTIKRICRRIGKVFDMRLLNLKDGGRRYTPSKFSYPSISEAWRSDWENIGNDFRRAMTRLETEVKHV